MNRKTLLMVTLILFFLFICFRPQAYEPVISFERDYAEVGVPFGVSVSGYPLGTSFAYRWTVGGHEISETGSVYVPKEEDLENFITVTVMPSGDFECVTLSTYFSRLPVAYLTVEDEIEKEQYVKAQLHIQGNSLYPDSSEWYRGSVELRGRGNSTWEGYPKKPYKLKLEEASDLFGMEPNKHWVLLANYADESLMRNKLAYDLSGILGMPYMESTWLSLVLNGEYIGNYQLCEQIRIGKGRVDITDLTDYAKQVARALVKADLFSESQQQMLEETLEQNLEWLSSGVFLFENQEYDLTPYVALPDLSGGFLMEIDGYFDEISKFLLQGQPLMFRNPEYACTNEELMNYAREYFDAFFSALLDSEDFYGFFQGKEVSYTELFDIRSLAQYILIQEIFFNYDAALKSNYLYKDIGNLAYMGPVWDMDWSSGRSGNEIRLEQWCSIYYTETADETLWYSGLLRDPYFLSVMKELWDLHYEGIVALAQDGGVMDQMYEYLKESGAANSALWFYEKGFSTECQALKRWLQQRITWLTEQFADMDTLLNSIGLWQADPSVELTLDEAALTITAQTGERAEIYWNSLRWDEISLNQGSAVWSMSEERIWEESDVILVRVYNGEGELVGSDYLDGRSIRKSAREKP